jgi:hypothetical protein
LTFLQGPRRGRLRTRQDTPGFPWLELIRVDSGYDAWQVDAAMAKVPRLLLGIVKGSDDMKGLVANTG